MPRKYAGETDSKRIVRAAFWSDVKRALGPQSWSSARFAVLSGPVGGDVSTLLGMGVHPEMIWAVDVDKSACASARRLFPEVNHHWGRVCDLDGPFAVVHMDVCGNGGRDDIIEFANAARMLPDNGLLGIGMMYGREDNARLQFMEQNLDEVVELAIEQTDGVFHGRTRGKIAPYFNAPDSHRLKMFMARHLYYRRKIMDLAATGGILLQCERTYFYKGHSTPMLYQLSRVLRVESRKPEEMFQQYCDRLAPEPRSFFIVSEAQAPALLRQEVSKFNGTYQEAALVYNVAPRTVAAWKAHNTRRTEIWARI